MTAIYEFKAALNPADIQHYKDQVAAVFIQQSGLGTVAAAKIVDGYEVEILHCMGQNLDPFSAYSKIIVDSYE